MSWTKEELIKQALLEIGLGDYVFNLTAEELQSSLRSLDAMMAVWNSSKGIRIGYPLTSSPSNSQLTTDTNVPDVSIEAIVTNLAIRIAPSFGKAVSNETRINASRSYDDLLSWSVSMNLPTMKFPGTLPVGSGNKNYGYNSQEFFQDPIDNISVGSGNDLELYN